MGIPTLLDLEELDVDLYRGRSEWPPSLRVFGGEVAAQSLVAAGATVPGDRAVHSLHAYFLRPGDPSLPIIYQVERVRDGGRYTTRRVTARQRGEVTFTLSASFASAEEGFAHQLPTLTSPPPDELPPPEVAMAGADELSREWFSGVAGRHPFDMRFHGELPRLATSRGERVEPRQRFWFRSQDRLPDDQLVHSCAATYASDMLLLSSSVALHGVMFGAPEIAFASLDHAVWFHGPFRADDWIYYDQESSWAGGGRAICQGRMFDPGGRLVATVMQEGMVRHRPVARPR
jgi:acyl-CoA thioesterase-2